MAVALKPTEIHIEEESAENKETSQIVSIQLGVGERKRSATEEERETLKPYTEEVNTIAEIINNLREKTLEMPKIINDPKERGEDIYTRTLTQQELPCLLRKPEVISFKKVLKFIGNKDTSEKTDLIMISPLGEGKIEVITTVNELINVIKKEGGNDTIDGEGIQTSVVEKGDTLVIKTFTPKGTQVEYTIQI